MADEFRIERYRRADREQVFDLMRAAYPADQVARETRQWDWKHDANPFNADAERYRIDLRPRILPFIRAAARPEDLTAMELRGPQAASLDEPYCVMLKSGAQLAGILCLVPQRFCIAGAEHWAIIGSNFIVHPGYRGRKLSVRLSLTMRADNAMNINFTNQSGQGSARSVTRTLRGKAAAQPDTPDVEIFGTQPLIPLFKPIDWREVAGYLSDNGALKSGAAFLGAGIDVVRKTIFPSPAPREVNIREVDSFDDRIDALWTRVGADYPVMAARDRRYLRWRFHARPDVSYRYLIALRGDDIVGYMVFRMAPRDGMRCGYIIDYVAENRSREVFSLLLAQAEASMRQDGAKAIICAVAPAPYRATLWRSGYFPARLAATSYLNAEHHTIDPALAIFADLRQWFVTSGDGDLDFSY